MVSVRIPTPLRKLTNEIDIVSTDAVEHATRIAWGNGHGVEPSAPPPRPRRQRRPARC